MNPSNAVFLRSETVSKDGSLFTASSLLNLLGDKFLPTEGGPRYIQRMMILSNLITAAQEDPRPQALKEMPAHHLNPIDSFYYPFLYIAAAILKPKVIVELGTDYGVSAIHLKAGNPEARVITVDHSNRCHDSLCSLLPDAGFQPDAVEFWEMDTAEASIRARKEEIEPDILFVDSRHDLDTPKRELEMWSPLMKEGGHIFMDDVLSPRDDVRHLWPIIDWDRMEASVLHMTGQQGFGIVFVPDAKPYRPILRS